VGRKHALMLDQLSTLRGWLRWSTLEGRLVEADDKFQELIWWVQAGLTGTLLAHMLQLGSASIRMLSEMLHAVQEGRGQEDGWSRSNQQASQASTAWMVIAM